MYQIVNFALSLNRLFFVEQPQKAINTIFAYAANREAEKIQLDDYNVMRQVVYFYRRGKDIMPQNLRYKIDSIEDFPVVEEEDFNGFQGDSFKPDEDIDCLLYYSQTDKIFLTACRDFIKFYTAFNGDKKLGIDYKRDYYTEFLQFYKNDLPKGKCVPTSLPHKLLLESQAKTDGRYFAFLAMYSAIRSIIGRKTISETTKGFIYARMFGAKDEKELNELIKKNKSLAKYAEDWNPVHHRRKFAGLLSELQTRGFILWHGDRLRRRIYLTLENDKTDFSRNIAQRIKSKKTKSDSIGDMIQKFLDDG